jgi:hypothetical protein
MKGNHLGSHTANEGRSQTNGAPLQHASTPVGRSQQIMEENFFGVDDAVLHFGFRPLTQWRKSFLEVPFSEADLFENRKTHVLLMVIPLSIVVIWHSVAREHFYSGANPWFENEDFAKEVSDPHWQLVRATCVSNDQALDDFVKLVKNYTTDKEIPEAPQQGWDRVVTKWKSRMVDMLYSRRRLRCDPYDGTWDEFWIQFDRDVLAVTRRHLLDVLFDAWRHFFDADTWSVAQALMELRFSESLSICSVREVANYLRAKATENSRFEWVQHYENNVGLEAALRKNHLGDLAVFGTLRQFAFVLDGRPFHPLVATMRSGRLEIELHIDQMYRLLCANLQIEEDEEYFQRICHRLMT